MPERDRPAYRVEYTESAATIRDSLPEERQQLLARGLRVLGRDPYAVPVSAQIGPDEHARKAMVAPMLLIEYTVSQGLMIVVVVSILDDMAFIATEED